MLKMARRRNKRNGSRNGLGGVRSIVSKVGQGMLGAMVVGSILNKFAPQYASMGSIAGAYVLGGGTGALGTLVLQGGLSNGSSTGLTVI